MSIAPDQIRARVSEHLLAALEPLGWVELTIPYGVPLEVLGIARELADRSFVVGLGESVGITGDRQIRGEGLRVRTNVGVRAVFRVRADAGVADANAADEVANDEDRALREERRLLSAILAVGPSSGNPELSLQFQALARRYFADGTYLAVDVLSSCVHNYALSP